VAYWLLDPLVGRAEHRCCLLVIRAHPDDDPVVLWVKHGEHEVVDVLVQRGTDGLGSVHDISASGPDLVPACARARGYGLLEALEKLLFCRVVDRAFRREGLPRLLSNPYPRLFCGANARKVPKDPLRDWQTSPLAGIRGRASHDSEVGIAELKDHRDLEALTPEPS